MTPKKEQPTGGDSQYPDFIPYKETANFGQWFRGLLDGNPDGTSLSPTAESYGVSAQQGGLQQLWVVV